MIIDVVLVAFIVLAGFQIWYDCTHDDGMYRWDGENWVRNKRGRG